MRLDCNQVFYGRGEGGYGVLGVSRGGERFAARVESLCGGVGTSDGGYGGEPFLMSVPEGEWVVMVCGRRGEPDSMGRGTLFFHALVAKAADLEAAGADAFSLFAQGAFAERVPDGGVASVHFDVQRGGGRAEAGGTTVLPAAIRSGHPVPEAVRLLAGGRVNTLRWATYAFQPMPGFDIQVLPPRTALPRGTNEYDSEGRLVRAAAGAGSVPPQTAESSQPTRAEAARSNGFPAAETNLRPAEKGGGLLLKLSLIGNAVLAVLCAILWLASPEKDGNRAAAERFRAELAAEFPQTARIDDFRKEASGLPKYDAFDHDPKYAAAAKFLGRTQAYVDFVNNRILANPPKKDVHP